MIEKNSRIVTNVRNTKEIAQPARMLRILANLKKDGDYMLMKSTHSKKGTYVPDYLNILRNVKENVRCVKMVNLAKNAKRVLTSTMVI